MINELLGIIGLLLTILVLTIKATLPGMIKRKAGCIVNIGTVNAKAMIGSDSYSVAKAGIHALTRTVAVRYGPDGIRCTTVVPGTIATDAWQERVDRNPQIFEKLKPIFEEFFKEYPDEDTKKIIEDITQKREAAVRIMEDMNLQLEILMMTPKK
jgi:NAD(P)-dependent dehydrogenase (short-subunit alcohol dehydrogenase family)